MDRRYFLKTTACLVAFGLTATSGIISGCAAENNGIDNIGIQLYSIRNMMAEDRERTIAQVAETGYKEVEFFDYYGRSAKQVKAMLDQISLFQKGSDKNAQSF